MPLDQSLEARVVGVGAEYKDSRVGATSKLPQRVYMIAMGASDSTFSTTKFRALSAAEVGSTAGYTSEAYLMARQLLPQFGEGLGSVPLTVALLADAEGSVAATGDITPSGTASVAGQYRVNVAEVLSDPFVIPKGAVNVTDTCRKIGNAINSKLGMPGKATYAYGTVSETFEGTGDGTLASFTTTGNPKPGDWTLVCTAEAVDAGTFTLTDPDGVILSQSVTIGAQVVGGLGFTLTDGTADYEVGDAYTITVPATAVNFTCGWKGTTGNDITLQIDGPSYGVEFAITQPSGGLVDPTVDNALLQIGNSWETMILNGLSYNDSVALDTYQAWGEGRKDSVENKPCNVITGHKATTPQEAIVITDARKDDGINVLLPVPGSRELPCVVAARAVARAARSANNNPSRDFCLLPMDGIVPGIDAVQWNLLARDTAVKGGCSTVEVEDGVVKISNLITCYHPTGEVPPADRYLRDQVIVANVRYNLGLIFKQPEWAGASLVPDDQAVVEPTAKKPSMALTEVSALADALGKAALISDVPYTKANSTATINSQNAKRLDIAMPIKVSGTTNIIDVMVYYSFYFGGQAA